MSRRPPGDPGYFRQKPSLKGRGVRSLNKVPLLMLGAVTMLVGGGLGFTFYEKGEGERSGTTRTAQAPNETPSTASSVLSNAPTGIIPARETPNQLPQSTGSSPTVHNGGSVFRETPLATPPTAAQLAEQQAQSQLIQEQSDLNRDRMSAETSALSAGSDLGIGADAKTTGSAGGVASLLASATSGLGSGTSGSGVLSGLVEPVGGAGASTAVAVSDPNGQEEKTQFAGQPPQSVDLLAATKMPLDSPYELRAGTVLPALMVGGINSDLPGQIIGQVSENIYDTATGQFLLIPQGTKLIGTYDSRITTGQSRVLVAWNRLIFPDGESLDISGMSGADQSGYSGFSDQVDNHYLQIFGAALMTSLFSAGIQLSQPQTSGAAGTYSSQQVVAGAVGQQLGNAGIEIIERNSNIQPTLIIRPGYVFNVMVSKDIVISPYDGTQMPTGSNQESQTQ